MKTLPFILAGLFTSTLCAVGKAPAPEGGESGGGYIAHEWGTFTSVQGAEGVQLDWNPLVVTELPKFVYDMRNPSGRPAKLVLPSVLIAGKTGTVSRQRMETPVIYFYSDKARTVDVDVNFPDGQITEWYPQLAPLKTAVSPSSGRGVWLRSSMHWGPVDILPGHGENEAAKFPKDETGSHYYAARETDASAIHVKAADGTDQYEKFLFYRGVGQFEAPLLVTHWGDHAEQIHLGNRGKEAMGPYYIYAVRGDKAALVEVGKISAGQAEDRDFKFDEIARPVAEVRAELAGKLRATLTSAGLYEKEAAAMVKTWDDSWMGEQGLRVLYALPQKWADATLPLNITPAPTELKRVFVGRAEIITPSQEWALLKETVRYAEGGALEKKAATAAGAQLGLGRFTDAGFRLLGTHGLRSAEFSLAVSGLVEATRPTRLKTETAAVAPQ